MMTSPVVGSITSSAATRPRMRSFRVSITLPGAPMAFTFMPRTRSPRLAKQSTSRTMFSWDTSTRRRVM